jgi:RNA polymerase sigma-70 factor (ECF subfamily)
MSEPSTDDASLVDALARGNCEAAGELYRRHSHPILRFALAMTNSRAAAEDIVHDTFVELLRRPRNYDPTRGSITAFLYGIARHRIAKAAVVVPYDPSPYPATQSHPDAGGPMEPAIVLAASPEEDVERAQDIERLRAAIGSLPLVYREIIAWCDLEEVPYATVADILDCPIGTVRSRLHRARTLLAEAFRLPRPHGEEARAPHPGGSDVALVAFTIVNGMLGRGPA